MATLSFISRLLILRCLAFFLATVADATRETDAGLYHFKSRPDLKPPRWHVEVHDEANLAPGYWFLGPYKSLHDDEDCDGWIGPTIYEGNGELVWSGAAEYGCHDVEDVRISNIRGEDLLTFMHSGQKASLILNNDFTVRERILQAVGLKGDTNTHEFQTAAEGTEVMVLRTDMQNATLKSSRGSRYDRLCQDVHFEGFDVLDTTNNWAIKFSWKSQDYIPLEESLIDPSATGQQCVEEYDYVHANSVDKDPKGNYLYSCRHTDTIYYIDGRTGDVLWRLGGRTSDFKMGKGVKFSRQHNIRWRRSEGSLMWITMLDNAMGQDIQDPTHQMSRGLRLVLNTKVMTAEVDLEIEHPDGVGSYAFRRGSYQVLPNDNIFIGWSEQATQSEHDPKGQLLMKSWLETEWLGTYRAYKFPFVGRPKAPPDVVSTVTTSTNHPTTFIFASYNGMTDIAAWKVYSTDATGQARSLIATAGKTGFETEIVYGSLAEYVVVEAIDKSSTLLGTSHVIKSRLDSSSNITTIPADTNAVHRNLSGEGDDLQAKRLGSLLAFEVIGSICLATVALSRWRALRSAWRLAWWTSRRGRHTRDLHRKKDEEHGDDGTGHRQSLVALEEKYQ